MKKQLHRRIFAGLIVVHFALMALGMTKIHVRQDHWAVKAARYYAGLTGAGVGFGFFSPDIPHQISMNFDVVQPDGEVLHTSLQDTAGSDVMLRLGNMIRMLSKSYEDKKIYRSMTASLTASMFSRYPQAKEITLHATLLDFPTMKGYRDGLRPVEKEIYSASYGRRQ